MKTILVPTDYSRVSENALNYAVHLADTTKAKLILFHAYHVPLPVAEFPVMMVSSEDLEKENNDRLKKTVQKIKNKHKNIEIEIIVCAGFAVDEILSLTKQRDIDLVVMGVTGAGKAGNFLLGSNAISVMKKSKTPVLIIPQNVHFRKVEKIVLAFDYKNAVHESIIKEFKKIVKKFGAKVFILDIVKPEEVPAYEEAVVGISMENSLKDIEHTLHFPVSEDVTEEINSFVDVHKADWLVMLPHHHPLLASLFHQSNTKRMAFHTHIPLLSLHA